MCYLVAKDVNKIGSIAWQTTHGKQLAEFKSGLIKKFGYDRIQFVTISRPSAYGEYEPYQFVQTQKEYEQAVEML